MSIKIYKNILKWKKLYFHSQIKIAEEYNAWLDNMDSVWLSLTDEEQEYLSKRNLMEPFIGVEPII